MVIKKIRKVIWVTKETRKPVVIKFKRKDGTVVRFKGTKITRKPQRIVLKKVRRVKG